MHCPVQTQERCSESKHIVLTLPSLADIKLEEKRAQVYLITVPAIHSRGDQKNQKEAMLLVKCAKKQEFF